MKQIPVLGLIAALGLTLHAQTLKVRGRVSNGAGQAVANAVVALNQLGLKDTTGSDGTFAIDKSVVSIRISDPLGETSRVEAETFDGNGRRLPSQQVISVRKFRIAGTGPAGGALAKIGDAADTLTVSAAGYAPEKIGLASQDTTVNVTLLKAGVPQVKAKNATTVPATFGNAVANPGKLTTNVTYPAYWYSTSATTADAFKSMPTIPRQTTPKTKYCNVYTPPGFDPHTQYPLVVIMHGITDNPNTWIERTNPKIATMLDNLIVSKATRPFIAVFASGTVDNNTNAYYAFGGELMNDLLPFIESKYPVRKDRASRAMAGFSFGGMQTLTIGLCARLKEFAWFGGLHPAGPPTPNATDIAKYVAAQEPEKYPLHYLYIGTGSGDANSGAGSSNGLTAKGPYITSANFSWQNNIAGGGGAHNYQSAQVALFNFLQMAFSPDY